MVSGSAPLPACAALPYKALQGRLPYRLLRLFTVDLPAATGPHPHWLGFVELTRAVNSGTPEEASQLVRVTKPNAGAGYALIDASRITGAAHLIPQEPNCAGVVTCRYHEPRRREVNDEKNGWFFTEAHGASLKAN
jgi:hypothetical protein